MKKVTAALLVKDNKILIAQRSKDDPLAYKWEFPGGKIEAGETPEQCLAREMKEEFGIDVQVGNYFGNSIYYYDRGAIELLAYWVTWPGGALHPTVHDEYRWVTKGELYQFDFAPADIPLVEQLVKDSAVVNFSSPE